MTESSLGDDDSFASLLKELVDEVRTTGAFAVDIEEPIEQQFAIFVMDQISPEGTIEGNIRVEVRDGKLYFENGGTCIEEYYSSEEYIDQAEIQGSTLYDPYSYICELIDASLDLRLGPEHNGDHIHAHTEVCSVYSDAPSSPRSESEPPYESASHEQELDSDINEEAELSQAEEVEGTSPPEVEPYMAWHPIFYIGLHLTAVILSIDRVSWLSGRN